jgi:hypothetical protein
VHVSLSNPGRCSIGPARKPKRRCSGPENFPSRSFLSRTQTVRRNHFGSRICLIRFAMKSRIPAGSRASPSIGERSETLAAIMSMHDSPKPGGLPEKARFAKAGPTILWISCTAISNGTRRAGLPHFPRHRRSRHVNRTSIETPVNITDGAVVGCGSKWTSSPSCSRRRAHRPTRWCPDCSSTQLAPTSG